MTTTENTPQTQQIGQSRLRKEDRRLITGRTRWTDNQAITGLLHLAIVRSPISHAEIGSIDTSAAKQIPGVVAVYTASDIGADAVQLPCAWPITKDMKSPQRPALAGSRVNFAGEGVAVVVARSAAAAKDAAELVEVDYSELEPVL